MLHTMNRGLVVLDGIAVEQLANDARKAAQ